jgi:hypothetical protein
MKLGLKLVLALLVVMLVAGCTTIGHPYDASKIGQFVVGQTTVDQAVATLGEPQERETESDGAVRLHYQYIPTDARNLIPFTPTGVHVKDQDTYLYFDRSGHYVRSETNQSST